MQVGENNIQIINSYASPKVTLAACTELEVPSLAEQAEELSAAASLLGNYAVSQIDINSGCVISPPDLARLDGSVESFSRSASLAGDTGTGRRRLLKWQRTGNTSRSRQQLSGRFHARSVRAQSELET
jgi:hypothetical protein